MQENENPLIKMTLDLKEARFLAELVQRHKSKTICSLCYYLDSSQREVFIKKYEYMFESLLNRLQEAEVMLCAIQNEQDESL